MFSALCIPVWIASYSHNALKKAPQTGLSQFMRYVLGTVYLNVDYVSILSHFSSKSTAIRACSHHTSFPPPRPLPQPLSSWRIQYRVLSLQTEPQKGISRRQLTGRRRWTLTDRHGNWRKQQRSAYTGFFQRMQSVRFVRRISE